MSLVDCNTCINIDTDLCSTCIHNEDPFLADHYERATPEMIVEREAKELKKIEDSLCHEVIQLELAPEFIKTFSKCKRFSCNDGSRPKYMPVEARKDSLVSTNACVLCELYCDVPPELQGKNIVKIEADKIYLAVREPCFVPDKKLKILPDNIDSYFQYENTVTKMNFSTITVTRNGEKFIRFSAMEHNIILKAAFYDTALDILGDIHLLGYTNECSVVVFLATSGRVAIGPVLL